MEKKKNMVTRASIAQGGRARQHTEQFRRRTPAVVRAALEGRELDRVHGVVPQPGDEVLVYLDGGGGMTRVLSNAPPARPWPGLLLVG